MVRRIKKRFGRERQRQKKRQKETKRKIWRELKKVRAKKRVRKKVRRSKYGAGQGHPKVSKGSSPRVALARRGSTCSDVVPMLFLGSATI